MVLAFATLLPTSESRAVITYLRNAFFYIEGEVTIITAAKLIHLSGSSIGTLKAFTVTFTFYCTYVKFYIFIHCQQIFTTFRDDFFCN